MQYKIQCIFFNKENVHRILHPGILFSAFFALNGHNLKNPRATEDNLQLYGHKPRRGEI